MLIAPFRRGHGLSGDQGAFIGEVLDDVNKREGVDARSRMAIKLLEGDHLDDQQAALDYLRKLPYVDAKRIAVAGVSFGKTVSEGHSFGYYGADIWGQEVLAFLREALK